MKFRWIISGAVLSIVLAFVFVFFIAVAEYATSLGEGAANVLVYIAVVLSAISGAVFTVRKSQTKVLFNAMAMSLILILIMILSSLAVNGRINTDMHCVSMIAGMLLSGFLGALIGQR